VLRRNIGVLMLRRSAAAAERGARRRDAILRLPVRQATAHLRSVRETVGRVCLRSNMSVRYVGVRRWEAWAGLGVILRAVGEIAIAVVFTRCLRGLDAIARLDHVGLEGDWSWAAV
jgi:hypothetical protein